MDRQKLIDLWVVVTFTERMDEMLELAKTNDYEAVAGMFVADFKGQLNISLVKVLKELENGKQK